MRCLILIPLIVSIGGAQSTVEPPLAGILRDPAGQVRRILGVSGNLLAPPAEHAGVKAAEFTGRSGMIKTDAVLILLDDRARPLRSFAAPAGGAIFGFDSDGMPSLCYFESGELWDLASDPPRVTSVPEAGGKVLALEPAGAGAVRLLVAQSDGVWLKQLERATGVITVLERLATEPVRDARMNALLLDQAVRIRMEDGEWRTIALPEPASALARMGEGWLAAPPFAVRRGQICRLPGEAAQ